MNQDKIRAESSESSSWMQLKRWRSMLGFVGLVSNRKGTVWARLNADRLENGRLFFELRPTEAWARTRVKEK